MYMGEVSFAGIWQLRNLQEDLIFDMLNKDAKDRWSAAEVLADERSPY